MIIPNFVIFRDNIGFPIVEVSSDGQFIPTKPPDTGGLINQGVVSEQVSDPFVIHLCINLKLTYFQAYTNRLGGQ